MKKQTQKTATASPKARRKSETLTLGAEASLALKQVVGCWDSEERASYPQREPREADRMARLRRHLGNRLLALACEAVMEKGGSIQTGSAWWKLVLTQMSNEEIAATEAMIAAKFETIGGSLEPIDDATEAAAIQKLQAGKFPAARTPAPSEPAPSEPASSEAAPGIAPAVRFMGCIEQESDKGKPPLFGLEMLPHGWQRIQEMLAESPEVKIVFRIERGEKQPFTGWRFVTATEADETDDED